MQTHLWLFAAAACVVVCVAACDSEDSNLANGDNNDQRNSHTGAIAACDEKRDQSIDQRAASPKVMTEWTQCLTDANDAAVPAIEAQLASVGSEEAGNTAAAFAD